MSTTYKHVTMQSINAIYLLFLRSAAAARITGPNKTPPALITKHNKEGTAGRPPTRSGAPMENSPLTGNAKKAPNNSEST